MDASAVDVDGEIIAAVVPFANVAPDPEHLRGLMRDVVPGGVPCSVRLVDDLPRNAAGKVRRIELRARLSAAEDDP